MSDQISQIQSKVDKHDIEIMASQRQMKDVLLTMREAIQSIQNLTLNFQRYSDKHDRVAADQEKLAEEISKLKAENIKINTALVKMEPMVDLMRLIYTKLTWSAIIGFVGFVGMIGTTVLLAVKGNIIP